MRSPADRSLIVISLETYSMVSRLFDYAIRTQSPKIKLRDIEFQIFREDVKSLYLDVHFYNVSYHFIFRNNGWLTIKENQGNIQTERFSMGFSREDHNFMYTGDRDFCLEVCKRLIDIIKKGFNLN